jgi:hypothetical protein
LSSLASHHLPALQALISSALTTPDAEFRALALRLQTTLLIATSSQLFPQQMVSFNCCAMISEKPDCELWVLKLFISTDG